MGFKYSERDRNDKSDGSKDGILWKKSSALLSIKNP